MKYCIYCGWEVKEDDKKCPLCGENISETETNKLMKSNVECVNCHSKNVECKISKKKRKSIVFEDESYICNDCNEEFTNKARLGRSFSNQFQLILTKTEKEILKIVFIICIVLVIAMVRNIRKNEEYNSWKRIDYTGLPTMTFKEIKDEADSNIEKARKKYVNNTYIFTTIVKEIKGREIVTPIESGDYTGSYIYVNNEDMERLNNYSEGSIITIAGTVTDISMYHKVYVKNATIVEKNN